MWNRWKDRYEITDAKIYRQRDIKIIYRYIDRKMEKWIYTYCIDKQIDRQLVKQVDRQINRKIDSQIVSQLNSLIVRQVNKQLDKKVNI